MRGTLVAFVAVVMIAAAPLLITPVSAQSYCQCVCTYDHYGRRHCRRVCPQPRYAAPAPSYSYSPPASGYNPYAYSSGPEIDFPLILLVAIAALIAIIVGVFSQSSNTDQLITDTTLRREDTEAVRAATNDTRAEVAAIDEAIESHASVANERGRARADEVFRDLQAGRHD